MTYLRVLYRCLVLAFTLAAFAEGGLLYDKQHLYTKDIYEGIVVGALAMGFLIAGFFGMSLLVLFSERKA